jgi:drug/metabolite transporter (DMT)-like permease
MEPDRPQRRGERERLRLKTALFLGVMVTAGPLGNVLLRAGMKHDVIQASYNPLVLLHEFHRFLTNADIWLGIGSRIVSALAFLCLLSWADYSYVNPAASVAYVIVVFFGWLLLGEVVPPLRWIGAILISVGVVLIGLTPANTTGQASHREKEPSAPGEARPPQTAS